MWTESAEGIEILKSRRRPKNARPNIPEAFPAPRVDQRSRDRV